MSAPNGYTPGPLDQNNNFDGIQRGDTGLSRLDVSDDPWAPIVLSLDGGGIRGLSELFILRRIMQEIQSKIEKEGNNPVALAFQAPDESQSARSDGEATLLPCYFFDYMIGTSTGGLIAVMLGRLRMSIDESIKAYWRLGSYVFWPRRYLRLYSAKRLKKAINQVVEEHRGYPANGSRHHAETMLLRQLDYTERRDVCSREHPELLNFTCKVAVVAQKWASPTQKTHLFRSYNHTRRFSNNSSEFNPGTLGSSEVKIWEACRATSAAPLYFRSMRVGADEFIDGGAGANNPSSIAWYEAKWMSNQDDPNEGKVAALVSLGCGEKNGLDMFGNQRSIAYVIKAVKNGLNQISNTQTAHTEIERLAKDNKAAYFRFSVKPVEGDHGNDGLASVKISECRKTAKNGWKTQLKRRTTTPPPRPEWYELLQRQATPQNESREKGGFNPEKYEYATYDTIFDRTEDYCESGTGSGDVASMIAKCASILLQQARARQKNDPEKWKAFVSHPHKEHRLYIESAARPEPLES